MFSILFRIQTLVFLFRLACDILRQFHLPLNTSCHPIYNEPLDLPMSDFPRNAPRPDETDTESEYDVEEEYADIEYAETAFEETDKTDGRYYLGVPFTFRTINLTVMNCSISTPTFFANEYSRVGGYLQSIATFYVPNPPPVDILQLHISDHGEYNVVVKTFWLRLVQRRWKNVLRLRAHVFARRASVQNQEYFRTHGRYLPGTRVLPGLRGMWTAATSL